MSNTWNPVEAAAEAARRVREQLETAAKHVKEAGTRAAAGELEKAIEVAVGPSVDGAYADGLGKAGTPHPAATARDAAVAEVADAVRSDGLTTPFPEDKQWKEIERRVAVALKPHLEDAHAKGQADALRAKDGK